MLVTFSTTAILAAVGPLPSPNFVGILGLLAMLQVSYASGVRKLDLLHLCFSLNFYFLMLLLQFPCMFSFTNLFSIILFPYLLIT